MPLRRWQARTQRLTWNRKQILRGKYGGEVLLLWPALCPLRRQLLVTFSSGSLEYGGNPLLRHRHRRLTASVEQHHDEQPIRTIAALHLVSPASDRTTSFVL
jgi:hypothetical protein